MRVVLDTNVMVSAFITQRSAPHVVMQLVESGALWLLMSEPVCNELERVLRYPHLLTRYRYNAEQIERFVQGIRKTAIWVEPTEILEVVSQDETDNRLLELALAGEARYLITGDKRHLLPLRHYRGIEIVSPSEFIALHRSNNI